MKSRKHLHDYQHRMTEWIKRRPGSGLFCEMGLGKTVATLTAIADLLKSGQVKRVLVIAPLRVAHHTWPGEIQAWRHLYGLTHRVIKGTPAQRIAALQGTEQVHIINRENVWWLVEHLRRGWPYDMLVIDESSSFKSPKSQRFKALRKVLPVIKHTVILTGTPASNGLLDLWSQIYLIDHGARLVKTFSGYRSRYFESDYRGFNWTLRPGAGDDIHNRLADVCLTLENSDYLELPARIDRNILLDLPANAREQYAQLEREFLLFIKRAEQKDGVIEALTAAALTNKLLQFCNGAVYTDEKLVSVTVHNVKLDALADIIEDAGGQSILVAYNYKSDLKRLQARFPQGEVLGRTGANLVRWNAGEIPLLFAHPASAGHGLNLQDGGSIVVWFGLNWSLELYQQFNARLHRQGQTKPVIIHHLVIRDSIDEGVIHALKNKNTTQNALLTALKNNIQNRS